MIEFEDDISLDSPSIEMVDYKTVQARKFSKDTHLMIITKRQTKEELDADYAQYLRLTIKQKLKANDMASKLFGMTNDQLYNQYKKVFEFGKEDMPGYTDTTSDINIGLNHDNISNDEDDIPMDIITRDVNRDTFVGQLQESMDLESIQETNCGVDNPAFFTPYEILTYKGFYSDNPDTDSLNEDISVLDWYNNYTRSFNGLITENYYPVWLEKMRSLYSDYDKLEGQAKLDRQQSIINLGWNPEIPFNEHNIQIGKTRLERECKYVQDIYEDYSHVGELSDKATAINESIDTNKDLPVYVVLTKGNIPFLSDAIRAFTDSEYSHAGIAFDPELDKIHSFAIAGSSGYQVENIRSRTSVESVFLFFLKKEKVLAMQKEIGNFAMNVNKTTYSMGGLIGKAVNVKYSNGNKYNQVCSSFVNYVLQIGGIDFVKTKNDSLASPADIYNALMTRPKNVYKVYEGEGDKYDSKKTSKIVKAIIKAKDSKALHPIRTIKDRITANEDYIEEKAKPNVCYRVVYDGADIYQNIKMGMFNDTRGMKEWENFTASKKYTWDQVPSDKKPSGSKVYYTEKGLKTFNSKVLPTAKLYLDKSKIKTQVFMMDPEKISYKDEYHIVTSKALSKVHESVELPDIYENIPYGYFGMFLEESVDITNSIELPDMTEVSKVIKSVPKEEPEFITEALNLPPGYTLRPAKASDMDYMYDCEMASIEPRLARQKKVQDYIRQDVKDAVKDTKIIMYKKDVVGVFTCCYIDGGERWYIAEIFVDKAHRGNGIATALIKNELSKHPKVRLQVALSNGKAKRLYERLGFEVTKKDEKNGMYIMDWEKGKSVEEFPDKNEPVIQEANPVQNEACKDVDAARHFVSDVKDLAKKYDANFFLVTDGASGTHNDGTNAAVKHARDSHKEWELKHGFDPEEDWGKNKKKSIGEAISMDDEGNMLIYKATLNTLDYGDAINKSSELCKLYKQSSNIEGIKYELCKLWYINCMLEKKIKRNDKNKEKYVNDRRICMNVFKTYMKHVNTIDDDFNFVEYYNATPYGGAIRIDKNTLKYSIKALKELLK